MKFLQSYEKYSQAFKANHSEHVIAKHEQINGHSNTMMTFFVCTSIVASFYFSFKTVTYFDWFGPVGIPIFFIYAFLIVMGFCLAEEQLVGTDGKMTILCNELKDNIKDNEKTILSFYLGVKDFLNKHQKNDTDRDIMTKIDDVIKAYALNNVQPDHIKKIIQIHKYIENEDVYKRFISFSDETINKIEEYKNNLFVQEPSIEKKPQYAEMM
jgi:hypothetical protein